MFRNHILLLTLITTGAWVSWFVVLNKLSPNNHTELALLFFFLSLFIALFSSFSLLLFVVRLFFQKENFSEVFFNISIRQGLLLSFLVILALILQLIRSLNWWTGLLLIVVVAILEYFFSTSENT